MADDTAIFTSNSNLNIIKSQLNEDVNSLANYFSRNEVLINLKKRKPDAILFGKQNRLNTFNKRQLYIKVGETSINCTINKSNLTLDTPLRHNLQKNSHQGQSAQRHSYLCHLL